jgi:hypothetical protein
MSKSKEWTKKEMSRDIFISHTVGHLETLMKLEVGGLPRMLVCFSLVEFGGRAFAAKERKYEISGGYKGFFKLMFRKMSEVTENKSYSEEDVVNALYDGWRNGLVHLLVPTKDFSIGDGTEKRNNHMNSRNEKLIISDKQFTWDLIKTFDSFISNHGEKSVLVYTEEHGEDGPDLNYTVTSSNLGL